MADWLKLLVGDAGKGAFGTESPGEAAVAERGLTGANLLHQMLGSMATLPQRAIQNSQFALDTGTYDPAPAVEAAMLPMGTGAVAGVPMKGGETVLGAGPIRALPTENYLGPISKHTKTLWREMSPGEALVDLPTSVASASYGPMGVPRKFYADHPDIAIGQKGNNGVKIEYDSSPFEGKINQAKPTWDLSFQNGMGEYLAAPAKDANIRDAVRSIHIDQSSLSRVENAQYTRILKNLEELGWAVEKADGKIVAKAPGQTSAPTSVLGVDGQPRTLVRMPEGFDPFKNQGNAL